MIAARFRQFSERVHAKLPGTRIFYVSICRAPQKKEKWKVVDDANAQIQKYCASHGNMDFIDVNPALVDKDGQPLMELYQPDQLHYKPVAYEKFTAVIKPVVARAWEKVQ